MSLILGSETVAAEIAEAESRAAVTEAPSEQPKRADETQPAPAIEPEKPAVSSETPAESGTVEEGEPADGQSNRSRRAVGREAAKLRRELQETKRQNEELQRQLQQQTAKPSAEPSKPVDPDAEPIETDFEDYSAYLKAVGRHEARQAIREEREAAKREAEAKAYEERFSKAREKHEDFEEALESAEDIIVPPAAQQAMLDSDDPGEIAYYLATHHEEAGKLTGMTPVQQVKEIGRIEARISSAGQPPVEQKPTPKPKPTAQALPAPLRPVSSVSGEPPAFDPFTASKDDPRWPAWRLERDKREGRFV